MHSLFTLVLISYFVVAERSAAPVQDNLTGENQTETEEQDLGDNLVEEQQNDSQLGWVQSANTMSKVEECILTMHQVTLAVKQPCKDLVKRATKDVKKWIEQQQQQSSDEEALSNETEGIFQLGSVSAESEDMSAAYNMPTGQQVLMKRMRYMSVFDASRTICRDYNRYKIGSLNYKWKGADFGCSYQVSKGAGYLSCFYRRIQRG